jgi:hypothetical protein
LNEEKGKGLDLPERVRKSLAGAVAERGVQARVISTQGRESMRPPQGHVIIAAGPVVRLALSVYPMEGEPLSAGTSLNVSQVSGDAALTGLGRQKTIYIHFYSASEDDLTYAFSKEIPNAAEQRGETKKVLKMARDAYTQTPEERRSFSAAVGLAERQFELPVPEPDEER